MFGNREEFAELNIIALNEFSVLVEKNTDLTSEWKETLARLLQSGEIPQDLEPIRKLIAGGQNVQVRDS